MPCWASRQRGFRPLPAEREPSISSRCIRVHNRRPDLILADLPGYGYAKISRSISAEWPAFINPYLVERETLAACVCLVDMNVPPQPGDVMLAEYLDSIHRPRIIVGTKADKLSGNQRVVATRRLREALETDDILVCSAKDGRGVSSLWKAIHGIAEEAKKETS